MPGTIHMQRCDAIVALLEAAPALVDGGVLDDVEEALPQQFNSHIQVYLDQSRPERMTYTGQPIDWFTAIRVECRARSFGGQSGRRRSDIILAAAYDRIQADPSLGGLCIDSMPEAVGWRAEEGDTNVGVAHLILSCNHRGASRSITN